MSLPAAGAAGSGSGSDSEMVDARPSSPGAAARDNGARPDAGDRRREDAADDDDDAEDEEEDERGIDLMGDNTGDEDSSEEEDEDSEEERRVRKDFIVDEDEAEERRRRRKKRKEKRKRREADQESSRKRRKDSDDDAGDLDEDDLALLEENTGVRLTNRKPKLKRLRRRKSVEGSDSERSDRSATGLNRIFSEDEEDLDDAVNEFADEMAGFIEDDTQSESGAGSDEDEDDRRARRARKRKERRKGRRAGLGGAPIEGISQEDWQEVTDVFGNGQDYAFALESDDEAEKDKVKNFKDIFEPSQIAARMMTEADEVIRHLDIPERMQLQSVGIKNPETEELGTLSPYIPEDELDQAAEWVATKVSQDLTYQFMRKNDNQEYPPLHDEFMAAIKAVLRFLNVEFLEVPFIAQHRTDYLVHQPPREEDGPAQPEYPLITPDDLWRVSDQSVKYRAFASKRKELRALFDSLDVENEYFNDVFKEVESVEQVSDLSDWLSMRFATELADLKEKRDREEQAELEVDGVPAPGRKKRATRESPYDIAKRSIASELAKRSGPSAEAIGHGFTQGMKIGEIVDPDLPPLDFAESFSGPGTDFMTPEAALAAAKLIVVHELVRDPLLRREARRYYLDYAVVNVTPTDKGRSKIDELNPAYAFKYMQNKPVAMFPRSSQFLQILSAEQEGLVVCRVQLPEVAMRRYMDSVQEVYLSDAETSMAEAWNVWRNEVLDTATQNHLFPAAEQWCRLWLQEEGETYMGELCRDRLYRKINVAPYYRHDDTMDKGDTPSVLALSHGMGDPKRDDVTMIFLDSDGYLREHVKIGDLFNLSDTDREVLVELLRRRRPQVVVIGGFSPNTKRLRDNFERIAGEVSQTIVDEEDDQDEDDSLSKEALARRARFEVTFVYDDAAKIFSNSQRAAVEFPELSKIGKYCVALARYVQSPLHEHAALGEDLTAITYDPAQKFVTTSTLRMHLERALVSVVNKVGVDINRAIRDQYYGTLLPFVSGLGPRKAGGLIRKITATIGGTLETRESLVHRGVLGKNIFVNIASFLRIPQDELEANLGRDREEQREVLDDTRIHPAEYEIARKMAADALEIDEEDLEGGEIKSQAIIDLMEGKTDKLLDLSLDDFAIQLQAMLNAPKRLLLYMIRDELRSPYRDIREEFLVPSATEVFSMLTGETLATLDRGLIIPVRVVRTFNDGLTTVRLDSGVQGVIPAEQRSEMKLRPGQMIQAQIIDIEADKFEVQLSAQEGVIAQGDFERRRIRPDLQFWDMDAAQAERSAQAAINKRAAGRQKRVINHPNFQNVDSGGAEQFLAHMQRGDCVIRPSSKEDHLAVTWKVADGIYQHIAVAELNKASEYSLGTKLRVGNRTYSDLDELIHSHIRSMSLKVGELTREDKFKGTQEDLTKFLKTATNANTKQSFYGFCYDPDRRKAGQFLLGARASKDSDVVFWPIKIEPGAFVFNGKPCRSFFELCNAFKMYYNTQSALHPAAAPTGRTPMHPSMAGGRTPHGYSSRGPADSSRTPLAAAYNSGRTPDPRHGTTPNPYARGGATPMRGGATPMYQNGPIGQGYGGYEQGPGPNGRPPPPQQYSGR